MDYEKRYKEALEKAKKELQTCGSLNCDAARQLFRLFPELKENENEDEKIRKVLLKMIYDIPNFVCENICNIPKEKCIAWLEKQGEKEPDPRYKYLEELLAADDIYQMAMNDTMVEEARTKAIEAISKIGITQLLGIKKQCKQIPAWSEEDERIRKMLIEFFSKGAEYNSSTNGISDKDIISWLEKQGNKPQGKSALEAAKIYGKQIFEHDKL